MRCLSCNRLLTDEEASIKYEHVEEIKNPEDRYICLCIKCLRDSDIAEYAPEEDLIVDDADFDDEGDSNEEALW